MARPSCRKIRCSVQQPVDGAALSRIVKHLALWRNPVNSHDVESVIAFSNGSLKEFLMLRMAIAFFVIALIAAVLGFTGIAVATAGIAKILFYIFLVLFLLSLVSHLIRRT